MTSINLLNLAKIGQLDPVPLSVDLVKRMLTAATVRVLDGLRKQRNLTDYDGELVTEAALQECLNQARAVLIRVENVLQTHPALGGDDA